MKTEPARFFEVEKSLKGLGYALRHPETWPPDFGPWRFLDCDRCAMGLAHKLGMAAVPTGAGMAEAFGLPKSDAAEIFCTGYLSEEYGVTTPVDIADRIDAYLSRQA